MRKKEKVGLKRWKESEDEGGKRCVAVRAEKSHGRNKEWKEVHEEEEEEGKRMTTKGEE